MDNQETDQADAEVRAGILDALGANLASKRKEAMAARASCGIEDEWTGDEEFYQGFDDANRHEFVNSTAKPSATGGRTELTAEQKEAAGSTVFPNITQPYVDAVAARVGDMLLPTDDRNFAVEATPIPDLSEDFSEALPQQPAPQAAQPASMPMQPGMPGQPQPAPIPDAAAQAVAELKARFDKIKKEAARKAEKAQERIDDWLVECQYHAEMRTVIDDCAKLGTGVVKGPVPMKRKASKWTRDEKTGETKLTVVSEIKPGSRRIDPWNLYPDFPACGDNIHNGSFVFEYDQISPRKLRELKGLPGYISHQVDMCLDDGPTRQNEAVRRQDTDRSSSKSLYDIWYFHGEIQAEELKACGCEIEEGDGRQAFPVMLTIVNDRVIRASLNPLDNGEFPYDVIPWKRRPGMPWGMGIARQIRTPQRIVVGATRRLMDNAGDGSGPQFTIRRGVSPVNGIWEIVPRKLWKEDDDAAATGATDPISTAVVPMMIAELTTIIQLGMKMAEDVTGMPLLLQGQQGKAPDTVGGMTILNNNANAVLRRVARLFDSCITEPHIRRYYAWLMAYGEYDDEKGDFQIVARGSSALVERDIQNQEMINILQLCMNPVFEKNPKKAMDEYLKSRRFDPATFDYTEEELQELQSRQPPEDPRVTAAKIMAEATVKRAEMDAKETNDRLAAQARMELNAQNFDAAQAELNRQLEAQLADQKLSSEERQHVETQKVALAKVTLQMRTQMNLSAQRGPQVATPPTEPAGRAQPGKAFEQ